MAAAELTLETFRDPAGSVRIVGDRVLREVRTEFAEPALQFLQSPTAQQWVSDGTLIETRFLSQQDGACTLEHPRVFFPSYPWEWTPSAWIAAADLTLDLCEGLLQHDLILKDATPLNMLFRGTRPVLVDVLSIERRDPESPLWLAYGQFVRTFLLPLAAYQALGWPLTAAIQKRDGYEPADLAPHLSRWQRWREPFRSLITLPLMLETSGKKSAQNTKVKQDPAAAITVLRRNLSSLRKHLRHIEQALSSGRHASRWSSYAQSADHYAAEDQKQKRRFVRDALAAAVPRTVLDLGANSGVYSRIAAESGAEVVAWDTDLPATEQNWLQARKGNLNIATLIANPARPTPAVGWRNAESLALLDRSRGRFDCVMMLGLIHHLLLAEQIPLPEVIALVREITTSWAIVEWVPARDPRFVDLLRGRDALYAHLDEAAFTQAATSHFTVVLREALPNGRVLFLLQAR
ncbi:MAG TPA: class I SAM-dependent methyltransferase [Acidobacteriaceae bacterium]|jgi:2-polyprenyl-3-methyl-5-hydroxy-6-metoxy-1,4-benzoquinol methylase|nr:class I SAM-dependent methyltransferase [Acidobacteriaceae bacterium]